MTARAEREFPAEYSCWQHIKDRCLNPRCKCFPRYGGRGITVCDRWRASFAAFFADVGPRPGTGYTIERIDNEQGYEPGNCCWVPSSQQQQNTRRTRRITFNGETKSLSEWARVTGLSIGCLQRRLRQLPVKLAFTKPANIHAATFARMAVEVPV